MTALVGRRRTGRCRLRCGSLVTLDYEPRGVWSAPDRVNILASM